MNRRRAIAPALALGLLLLLPACDRKAATLDREEDRDALVQRALERKRAQQPDEAIQFFMQALERKPQLARPHLELGLLYDRNKEDYLRAIYHYQRYLELRPQAEKKQLIEDMIRQARLSFAASLPNPPPGAVERIALMQREIDSLRHRLGAMAPTGAPPAVAQVPAAPAPAASPVAVALPAVPPPPRPLTAAPARPPSRTYVVQAHDTLSRIAVRMYQDRNQWKKIYDANRGMLPSPLSIRPGQTLVIP